MNSRINVTSEFDLPTIKDRLQLVENGGIDLQRNPTPVSSCACVYVDSFVFSWTFLPGKGVQKPMAAIGSVLIKQAPLTIVRLASEYT